MLAMNLPNDGLYTFNPSMLTTDHLDTYIWRKFTYGVVQISVSNTENHGYVRQTCIVRNTAKCLHELLRGVKYRFDYSVFWSKLTPFGWYFYDRWQYELGHDWALQLCREWYEYDGKRSNFVMDLEPTVSCPCTLDQALLDIGWCEWLTD